MALSTVKDHLLDSALLLVACLDGSYVTNTKSLTVVFDYSQLLLTIAIKRYAQVVAVKQPNYLSNNDNNNSGTHCCLAELPRM